MNRDLLLAILSMDSYNRGYGAGVLKLGGKGTKIGRATVGEDAETLLAQGTAFAAGFYAIAYDASAYGLGTVISYRGTGIGSLSAFAADALNGWGLAIGNSFKPQADLAIKFYKAVAGVDRGTDPFVSNVTLTGHSLGGGLAGLVGTIYHRPGVLFNNMPFETVSNDNLVERIAA